MTDKLESVTKKLAGTAELMPVISAAAMSGAFAFLSLDHYFSFMTVNGVNDWTNTIAVRRAICVVAGFTVMKILNVLEDKDNASWVWVREWGITVSMLTGPIIALLFFR